MADNGQPDAAVAARVIQQATDDDDLAKPWLHPDALTPRDYVRAKVALADTLGDRSPYELLVGEEMYPFCIWALKSRDDPAFTWEQALDTPFWEFRMGGGPPPPPTLPAGQPGATRSSSGGHDSKKKPTGSAPAPSSAPGTA